MIGTREKPLFEGELSPRVSSMEVSPYRLLTLPFFHVFSLRPYLREERTLPNYSDWD